MTRYKFIVDVLNPGGQVELFIVFTVLSIHLIS